MGRWFISAFCYHQWITHQWLHGDALPKGWHTSHHSSRSHCKWASFRSSHRTRCLYQTKLHFLNPFRWNRYTSCILLTWQNIIMKLKVYMDWCHDWVPCVHQDNCYYQGSIKNDNESSASISTCDGLRWALTPFSPSFQSRCYGRMQKQFHVVARLTVQAAEAQVNRVLDMKLWTSEQKHAELAKALLFTVWAGQQPVHTFRICFLPTW